MNIKEIEARVNTSEQSEAILNDLKVYINYLFQEEKYTQAETYLNKAIKLAGDLQLPREEGTLLIELGVYYWNRLDYKSALNMFRLSCGIFKQSKNEYDLVIASRNVGDTYIKIGDYHNAISFLKLSLDFLKKVKEHDTSEIDELSADINNSLGTAYRKCKSYALSISSYFMALELEEKHNLMHKICNTHLNIGKLFVDIGNFERGLKYFNKALELSSDCDDSSLKSHSLALIGILYRKKAKYSQAIPFFHDALNNLHQASTKELYYKIKIIYELALSHQELDDFYKVNEVCNKGLTLLQEAYYPIYRGKFKYLLGTSLGEMQDLNKAEKVLKSALDDIATEDTTNSLKYKILQAIATIYKRQNRYEKAYQTLLESQKYIDLMMQEKQEKDLLELEARFESQQKVREEIMLKKTNQEVLELKEKVTNLTKLLEDYQEIHSFFGVIPKDKILKVIKKHRQIHAQNGSNFTTLKLKLIADKIISQELTTRVLSDISKLIMFYTRNKDEVGYWGDDCLILILCDMKPESADKFIEKIKLPIYNDILKKEYEENFDVEFALMES